MGTNDPSPGPNKDWPLAFQTAMLQAWKSSSTPHARRFRCVLLSGRFVVQDQNASLWFLSETRKLKGRYEIAALSFAAQHKDTWATYIPKPGGVITPNVASSWWARSILSTLAGSWGIKSDELAAFVTELIAAEVEEEEEGMISNERLLARGRALLMEKQKKTS
ncbi:hypothetical protein K504DRAFT_462229 [Pleomassaria siparia CBS 279.74]|uniref:Uncharacterized protein n=1 Tax=Pleomassaria siparia CBS 279.74 TaxID=1314801 RepID=A0A6G1KMW2_9PLEO|nr:hypothetical protein K504DRAFT_462229 [Pleomassaria siparia CBS 279.74]